MKKDRVTSKPAAETSKTLAAADKSAARKDCEQHRENLLDSALEESFPASDPPSIPRTPC